MGKLQEVGEKLGKSHRGKSCWQQDIAKLDYARGAAQATLISGLVGWLFYRSLLCIPILVPVWIAYFRKWKQECMKKKQEQFCLQFKEAIQALSAALNVGYSVENAWKEVRKELELLYGRQERIMKELHIITAQLRMNVSMEQVLEEFADRTELEDVYGFTTVFVMAKRGGGDMIAIIRDAVAQIGDKIEVKREIETILASKKYEFRVMTAIPFFIIGYMSLSFPEFMGALYGTVLGAGVMTICLLAYLGACYLGCKIIEIEV